MYPDLKEKVGAKKGLTDIKKLTPKSILLKINVVFCFLYHTCMKLLPSPSQLLSQELCVTTASCSSNHNLPMLWGRLESTKEQEASKH